MADPKFVELESLTGRDAWEDTEYLPSMEAASYAWGAISCRRCQHFDEKCSQNWKITLDGGIRKCFFYKKKFEWLKKEDFDV